MQNRRPSAPNIDIAKLAWSNRWLLVIGLIAGLAGGYFQFVQSPAMFRSAAKVQIIESSAKNLPVEGLEGASSSRSFTDEALVMRSEHILKQAAELGELSTTPEFAGWPAESIAGMLAGSESLLVGPALETGNTSVFQIQYDSTSRETSQRVVQAVIDAYAAHLQEQYRNIGKETINLIQSAREDVLEKLTRMEEDFATFKKESGLIYRDGVTTSIHRDNADTYLSQQQNLMIQRAQLSSTLEATRLAVKEGRPTEAVLMALSQSSTATDGKDLQRQFASQQSSQEIARLRETAQLTQSERMRQEKLLPLQLERQELEDSVGADHPAINTIDKRIRVIEGTIEDVARSEQELMKKLETAWANADEQLGVSGDELDPEARLKARLEIGVFALRQRLQSLEEEAKIVGEAYEQEMEAAKKESAAEMRSAQFVREIGRQQELYDRIMERLDEVNLMSEGAGLKVFPLDTAKPGYQFAPSLIKSLIMGGFLGCMFVAGIALLREISDRSYHSAREIAEHINLPVIGHVSFMKPTKVADDDPYASLDSRLCTANNGKGAKAEAFRSIRTAIYFSNQAGDNHVLQITSPTPGDGKSTIAANLAISIAQSGRRVLLIDADLRRPRIQKLFGMECERGLAWAIEQYASDEGASADTDSVLDQAIHETVVPNLSVMLSGERPSNPAELLSSRSFDRLLEKLRSKYDMILIDTPPLLAVSDPSNVVPRADGVVLVVRLRKNIKPAVAQATRMLETLEANVLGVVVNGVGSRQARSYGKSSAREGSENYGHSYKYGYGYSYGYTNDGEYSEYYEDDAPKSKSKAKASRAMT
ncbi:capsular exopolysaccharide family [Rhodopirellula maiorica SM1]|uniref:non-specific protein-tyrosine kinase n=2 Tax=Novipirellula TaxID=2795426 RepID=M5RS17_9BACT|nr:capsular exopolysaccharide family [Rhodopirellula maiorica SM1]